MPQGLESLLPEYQEQYASLAPEIERQVQADLIRRGMLHSGEATDASARAKAKLLADLAGRSADTRAEQAEAARGRAHEASEGAAARREARRAQNLGLISSGLGAIGTGVGMWAMNRGGPAPNILMVDGKPYSYTPKGGLVPIAMSGGMPGGVAGAPGVDLNAVGPRAPAGGDQAWADYFGAPSARPPIGAGAPPGVEGEYVRSESFGVDPSRAQTAAPSMWQRARAYAPTAGAGLAGGLAGRGFAGLAGARGTGADVGSGLGGLAGLGLGARYGVGGAGLGALLGSFGGGLLGNLFR